MIETSKAIIQKTSVYQLCLPRNSFAVSVMTNIHCEYVAHDYVVNSFIAIITFLLIKPKGLKSHSLYTSTIVKNRNFLLWHNLCDYAKGVNFYIFLEGGKCYGSISK
jgi:hypothetical protein